MTSKSLNTLIGSCIATMLTLAVLVVAFEPAHAATLTPISTSLGLGSTGQDVTTLQTLLATSGTLYPSARITGYYGPLTQTAVTQFQIAYGLPAVGRVGPLTRAQLNSIIENNGFIDVDAPLISNVQVTPMTTSGTITWQTNQAAIGKVHYDSSPITAVESDTSKVEPQMSGTVLAESVAGTSHSITISGLNAGQTYYYSIESIDPSQNISVVLSTPFTTE